MFRNARAFAEQQGIDHASRFYLTLSMAYMGGFYNLLILPFLHGASVVIDHVFDARSSLSFWDRASRLPGEYIVVGSNRYVDSSEDGSRTTRGRILPPVECGGHLSGSRRCP